MTDVSNTHLSQRSFHYIVRGVIRDGKHVLLCKQRTGDYTFLPGGHVEFGESATVALLRELHEEIGIEGTIGNFLGAIENGWDGEFEISLVFEVGGTGEVAARYTPAPGAYSLASIRASSPPRLRAWTPIHRSPANRQAPKGGCWLRRACRPSPK